MLSLPPELANPLLIDGQFASKVMLDLTAYLVGPSTDELEYLLDLYESLCPEDLRTRYTIGELTFWPEIAHPVLTLSGQEAASAGIRRPYLEPVRRRIREGRAFEVGLWDGREIDDPNGSWSLRCRRIHSRSTGLHAFVRIVIPLQSDPKVLVKAAIELADNIEMYSGHGGLVFAYNPWLKEGALDAIYPLSRRFWGIDVDDLNDTLPLMKERIKGVNWITLVSKQFADSPIIRGAFERIAIHQDVVIEERQHALFLLAGLFPSACDQNRSDQRLDPYFEVAKAMEPYFLLSHPDFPSERFVQNENTLGWFRRFIEPDGWR